MLRRRFVLALLSLPFVRLGWLKAWSFEEGLVIRSGWVLKKDDE
jgi:hypothetical protein